MNVILGVPHRHPRPARGLSNSEIADHLFISTVTAKAHVARLLAKLGACGRVQLVITAFETGLVPTSGDAAT